MENIKNKFILIEVSKLKKYLNEIYYKIYL